MVDLTSKWIIKNRSSANLVKHLTANKIQPKVMKPLEVLTRAPTNSLMYGGCQSPQDGFANFPASPSQVGKAISDYFACAPVSEDEQQHFQKA